MASVTQADETVQVHDALLLQRVMMVSDESKKVHFRRRRQQQQQGLYVAPRAALHPGNITRREWLRFLTKIRLGERCLCQSGHAHRHWLWTDTLRQGYGLFLWRGRKYPAHRFAYIALRGVIPEGMEPDHLCRLGHCANPECIEVVPPQVNKLRSTGPSAVNAKKTHCPEGHLLAGDNLDAYTRKLGSRRCKICFNAQARRRYVKKNKDL